MSTKAPIPALVKALGWVSFFTDAASEMIYPLLPSLLRSFGAAPIWLGAMEGVAEAMSALVKWRVGPVVDRSPRKKPLVVAGYAIATVVRPLIAFASAGVHVVLLRSIDRIGKGIRGVPRDALVAAAAHEEALATAFAFHRMMDNAGSVLGPVVAFALLRGLELPLRTVIMLAIVPGIVSMVVLLVGVKEPEEAKLRAEADESVKPEGGRPPAARLPASVRRYLVVLGVFTLGASADSFLLLRATDLGAKEWMIPVLWLALSGAKALSNVPGGRLADRIGRKRALSLAWVLYAAFYAVMPLVSSLVAYGALVVAYGAYYGLAEGSERAMLAERAPAELRGRAFGAMHALTGVAVLPANLGFGALYEVDPRLAFGASAGCAAAAAVLLAAVVPAAKDAPRPVKTG
jgi:MFS family permease